MEGSEQEEVLPDGRREDGRSRRVGEKKRGRDEEDAGMCDSLWRGGESEEVWTLQCSMQD